MTPSRTTSPDHAVVAREVSKVFAGGEGVHRLDLAIPAGSIFGFIGPSGSGKTTTVRLLTGVMAPDDGSIEVLGGDPTTFDPATRARLGYMPQLSVLYPNLSVDQNLRFFASLYGLAGAHSRERRTGALEFVELMDHRDKRIAEISGGMQRRLSLAAALVHAPDVVFLDEPTAGIDPVLRRRFWDHFEELRDRDRTLFVTTQYVGEAAYCDAVGVLSDGRLVHVDTPLGLRRTAYGGDIVEVEFDRPPSDELVERMRPVVDAISVRSTTALRVRVVVEEASGTIPLLTGWLADEGVDVRHVEHHVPDFDEVFVELIEADRAAGTAETADRASA